MQKTLTNKDYNNLFCELKDCGPNNEEKEFSIENIIKNIPNFNDMYDAFEINTPKKDIIIALTQVINNQKFGISINFNTLELSNFDINDLMSKHQKDGWLGTYSIDTLNTIPIPKNTTKLSFIMNVLPHNSPIIGHWVAINITDSKFMPPIIEYYNPLDNKPNKLLTDQIHNLLDKISNNKFQFKINRVQDQSFKTADCGYFAMKFLVDKYNNIPFKVTTGFDNSIKGQKFIKKFKNKAKKFEYV